MSTETPNSDIKILLADKHVRIILWIFLLSTVAVFLIFFLMRPVLVENPQYVSNGIAAVNKYGITGLFIITFLAETILPFPIQPILGTVAVLNVQRIALMIGVATIASLLGNLTSFYLARFFREKFVFKYVHKNTVQAFDSVWRKRGDIVLIVCSIIPILPGNIVAFISGLSDMNVKKFSWIIVIGRGISFVLVVLLALKLAGSWFPWIFGMQ